MSKNSVSSLSFEAIGRVLEAVCNAGGQIPGGFYPPSISAGINFKERAVLDREVHEKRTGLGIGIVWAYRCEAMLPTTTSDSQSRQRYAKLRRIKTSAKSIVSAIEDDELTASHLAALFSPRRDEAPDLHGLIADLRKLALNCDVERKRLRDTGLDNKAPMQIAELPWRTARSALLLELGKVYKETFGGEPEIKLAFNREPYGPFLAFVKAVSREAGHPLRPDAIKKGWERSRDIDA